MSSSRVQTTSTALVVPADLHVEDVAEKYESLRWGNVFDRLYDPTTCEYRGRLYSVYILLSHTHKHTFDNSSLSR